MTWGDVAKFLVLIGGMIVMVSVATLVIVGSVIYWTGYTG